MKPQLVPAQVEAYPPILFELNGTVLRMSSRDYLLLGFPRAPSAAHRCLGIRDGGTAGFTGFVLGDTLVRGREKSATPERRPRAMGVPRIWIHASREKHVMPPRLMRNYYVVFDQARKRIGWGDVNTQRCGALALPPAPPFPPPAPPFPPPLPPSSSPPQPAEVASRPWLAPVVALCSCVGILAAVIGVFLVRRRRRRRSDSPGGAPLLE